MEKKATVVKLTKEQEARAEEVRKDLEGFENSLREAQESELPEADFRKQAEGKKKELTELLELTETMELTDLVVERNT